MLQSFYREPYSTWKQQQASSTFEPLIRQMSNNVANVCGLFDWRVRLSVMM